jgi:hypothetical protein
MAARETELSLGAARPDPNRHLRRRAPLVTREREQKPEQHLEIVIDDEPTTYQFTQS